MEQTASVSSIGPRRLELKRRRGIPCEAVRVRLKEHAQRLGIHPDDLSGACFLLPKSKPHFDNVTVCTIDTRLYLVQTEVGARVATVGAVPPISLPGLGHLREWLAHHSKTDLKLFVLAQGKKRSIGAAYRQTKSAKY